VVVAGEEVSHNTRISVWVEYCKYGLTTKSNWAIALNPETSKKRNVSLNIRFCFLLKITLFFNNETILIYGFNISLTLVF
jgi:hypothetical protein